MASFGHIFLDFIFSLFIENKKRGMGRDIHGQVLASVLGAPINKFFDVTPIGMIINRIRSDIDVFRGHMLEVPRWITDMSSHFIYIVLLFIMMDNYMFMTCAITIYITIFIVQQP